jgi:hypothetical protein
MGRDGGTDCEYKDCNKFLHGSSLVRFIPSTNAHSKWMLVYEERIQDLKRKGSRDSRLPLISKCEKFESFVRYVTAGTGAEWHTSRAV